MVLEGHLVNAQHSPEGELQRIQDWIFIRDAFPQPKTPDPTGIVATPEKKLQESNMSEDALKDYFESSNRQ